MSHQHNPGTRGICVQCGCGEERAYRGCNDKDLSISCLNKERHMSRETTPGSTHESESQYTMAQRLRTETQEVDDELDPEGGGLHYSRGKPPLALIPRSGTRALAEVFAFGATKYALHNWRKGILWSELLNSAKRHLDDFIDGEDNDQESGITHLAHAAWNCFALIEYLTTHPELDDRYIHPWGEEETEPEPGTLRHMAREMAQEVTKGVIEEVIAGLRDSHEGPFRLSV